MNYFSNAASFLVETFLGLYVLAVLLRFLFQLARADFYNPFSQFLVKATNPPLLPLRRVIPGLGGIDVASVVLLIALQMIKLYAVLALAGAEPPATVGTLVIALAQLIQLTVYVFFFAILIRAIMSWVNPYSGNPFMDLIQSLTDPLMRPARRLIPTLGGLDLSPILVLVLLQLTLILIVQPLLDLGRSLAF